jgi:DNA-binding LacI/PurR family transcriptional regulator
VRSGIRRRIADNVVKANAPLSTRPTSYDVAQLAGVSQSAVSRCFSPGASIAPLTRQKVERAARSLGYSPNALARSLITRRSGLVGLVVTTATLRYSPQIIHDLSDALKKAGLMPLLTALAAEHDLAMAMPQILNYRPEAIISLATVGSALLRAAKAHNVPIVLINRTAPKVAAASICCDQSSGVRLLVEGLISSGHRRFAFIAGPRGAPVSEERRDGFERALKMAQIAPLVTVFSDYTYEGGHVAAHTILAKKPRPDALVCANDAMALGVLDAARGDFGLSVPSQLSVTGFDDIPEAGRPTRMLTTVRQPTQEMAHLAVAEVIRLNGGLGAGQPSHYLIAGNVLLRNSTRICNN